MTPEQIAELAKGLVAQMRELSDKNDKLEARVATLEATVADLPKADRTLEERYRIGLKLNRQVKVSSATITVILALLSRGVTAADIAKSNIASRGKVYAIASWDNQFARDFIEIHKTEQLFKDPSLSNDVKTNPKVFALI